MKSETVIPKIPSAVILKHNGQWVRYEPKNKIECLTFFKRILKYIKN